MNAIEFNDLTLSQQDAALAALRALLVAIYSQRGGATEPPPVPVKPRVRLGTADNIINHN